jgi:hypothetical protein
MEVIILILLLIGFFIIRGNDRAADRSYNQWRDDRRQRQDAWIAIVSDKELENQLEEEIQQVHDEMWQQGYPFTPPPSAAPLLERYNNAMRAMGWTELNESDFTHRLCVNDEVKKLMLRILLAQRGKLRWFDAYFGITIGPTGGSTQLRRRAALQHDKQLIKYLSDQLAKHGITEPVYFTGPNGSSKQPVLFGSEPEDAWGVFIWEPMVFFRQS